MILAMLVLFPQLFWMFFPATPNYSTAPQPDMMEWRCTGGLSSHSKRPAELGLVRSRLYPMRSAERRNEIIRGGLVRQVQDREPYRGPPPLSLEQIILPGSKREDVARSGPGRATVVVLGAGWQGR
jgi:hypothetical protein